MNEQTSESLRAWFKQLEGIYPELYNTAHVICGNDSQAEYALRSAILEVWVENAEGGMGFREKLRSAVRSEALRVLAEEPDPSAEFTWPGIPDTASDPLLRQAAKETPEVQRALMLRHGVGLSIKRVSALTNMVPGQVRTALARFETRARRALPAQQRSRFEQLFSRAARKLLNSRTGIPHPSTVYRAFEAEASQLQVPSHRVSKVIYRVLVLVMALVCAGLFWLFAVLVQAPEITPEASPTGDPGSVPGVTVETFFETEGGQ